ncbi:predicted protein [Uncinocarpus reesii 1704]|uniref:DUF2293 domain-containing protein n=1 Tax=Uncinocarpus reesii (strain UAMH 1704) TaxID=336963 RepID=C4JTC6_UNCRE|nr:uncharacterized protein UREG_05715 [Uncinocarpus reesii 1704]EEP80873.1 predicted protein [Uncinocarpus reesii 1704]
MTRVPNRAAALARSNGARAKIRKHKIIMETVTQEKKKLRSVISFEAKAPPGYTFIPAGNPKFTSACKELCRKDGLKVFTVSTTPHQGMHNLSQQVHRIGYHFPSVVVATVCMERGVFLSSAGKVMPYRQIPSRGNVREFIRERRADSELSQNTINAEARDAIKDLFPNIPDKDLNQIIKTAFRKGKRKVGTAVELPLARRAQLAVVAHIRHVYTEYDRLLKLTSFQEARAAVEEPCLATLVQWRGDDETGETVLEDVFREVIVISDDEDDDETSDIEQTPADRDSSVEIVSSSTVVRELQTQPLPPGNRGIALDPSEDEALSGVRFIPESSRKRKAGDKKKVDRRGFSRYQAWDRAKDRYKDILNISNSNQQSRHSPMLNNPPVTIQGRQHEPQLTRQFPHVQSPTRPLPITRPADSTHSRPPLYQDVEPSIPQLHRRLEPPKIIRLADGSVFERADTVLNPNYVRPDERSRFVAPSSPHARGYLSTDQVKYHTLGLRQHDPMLEVASNDNKYRTGGHHTAHQAPGYITDPGLPLSRKRDSNGLLMEEAYHQQPPLEDLSGRMKVIDIDDARYQLPPKRSKFVLHNSIENSHPDGRRETTALPYPSSADFDLGKRRETGIYDPELDRQNILVNKTNRPNDQYPHPLLRRVEHPRPQIERKFTGPSQPKEFTTRMDGFPGEFDRGQVRQGQVSDRSHANHSVHMATGKPPVITAGSSSYRVRDDNNNVGPNQLSHISNPRHVLHGSDTHESREIQLKGPGPVHSVVMREASPERRPLLFNQDTRASRIYSHDFVRPISSPENNGPLRGRTYTSTRDDQIGPNGRYSTKYVQDLDAGRNTTDRRIAYDQRSLSPPTHRPDSRIAGPVHAHRFHDSRASQQTVPLGQQGTYHNRIVADSYHDIPPGQKRYGFAFLP